MLKLLINNSVCHLTGLTLEQFKAIRSLLSYSVNSQTAYYSNAVNTRRYLLGKKGDFPTGLLYIVLDYLKQHSQPVEIIDRRIVPLPQEGLFTLKLED